MPFKNLIKKTKKKFFSSFFKVYGFDSGLSQYLTNSDIQDLLNNNEPVWLLGKQYSTIKELKDLQNDFRSKIWITYRKNFPSIGGDGPTSDQGRQFEELLLFAKNSNLKFFFFFLI